MIRSLVMGCVFCTALALSFLGATSSSAHEVTPMRLALVPSEGRSQTTININNTRTENLPFEIKTFVRITEVDGTERLDEVDDAFVVFPPQGEVPGGSTQAVRIQYIGKPVTDKAAAYVVQVVEVPVEQPGFSGVRFTYNFGVAAYVEPPRAFERLSIVSAHRTETGAQVVIRNAGSKYGLLNTQKLFLNVGSERIEVTADDLASSEVNPLLPPIMDRAINIVLPSLPADGDVTAEIRSQ